MQLPPEAHDFSIRQQKGNAVRENSDGSIHQLYKINKDIVHQASNKLAVVSVIRNPHIVLSGVHATLQVGFTKAPSWGTVLL